MLRAKHIGKDHSSLAPVLSPDHNPSLLPSQAIGTVATAHAADGVHLDAASTRAIGEGLVPVVKQVLGL